MANAPAKHPCGACPYRKDSPSGLWHYSEYEKLIGFDGLTAEQPPRVFVCHEDPEANRLCAGWVGTHDMEENLGLRVSALSGETSWEVFDIALDYVSPVPLFESGLAAAIHGVKDYAQPDERAHRAQERLKKKRKDIVDG